MALGVVLLLVAALTTAAVGAARHDEGIDVASEPVADVRALVADQVPAGFEVAWAGEQSTAASVDGGPAAGVDGEGAGLVEGQAMGLATYLYGDAAASVGYPFAASDLVVNVWDASELTTDAAAQATGALDGLTGTVDATVRGHAALVCAPPSCTVDGDVDVTTLWWHETDDVEVVLASRSLTVDQVVAIANGLTIDQEDVTLGALPAGLPGPLDEVGRLHDTAVAATRDAVAHWVGYIDPADATGRFVDVTTLAGDGAELMALVWELGADEQVSVRGQDGWLAVADSGVVDAGGATVGAGAQAAAGVPQIDLIWQEASGVLVHVTSLGVSQDQVLDLVESLHAASDDEWLDVKAGVAADAEAAAAGAGAAIDANGNQVDAGAGASAGVGDDTGAGVEAEADAGVSASAGASGAGVDAQVGADVSVGGGAADVEAGLHADLGTEAVIGAVQGTLEQTAAAAAQAQAQLEEGVRTVPGADDLLP
ncbi:MAG TPA: hypothetical protein VGO78_18260 [Acidimicrobiales bacterium]|nr:hypothetical protein [Acidimicrobiales bacterium]